MVAAGARAGSVAPCLLASACTITCGCTKVNELPAWHFATRPGRVYPCTVYSTAVFRSELVSKSEVSSVGYRIHVGGSDRAEEPCRTPRH